MDVDGLLYLHNMAGQALASTVAQLEAAHAEIERLTIENEALRQVSQDGSPDA